MMDALQYIADAALLIAGGLLTLIVYVVVVIVPWLVFTWLAVKMLQWMGLL